MKIDRTKVDSRMLSPVNFGTTKMKYNFESSSKIAEERFRSMIKTSRDITKNRDASIMSCDSKVSGTNVSF